MPIVFTDSMRFHGWSVGFGEVKNVDDSDFAFRIAQCGGRRKSVFDCVSYSSIAYQQEPQLNSQLPLNADDALYNTYYDNNCYDEEEYDTEDFLVPTCPSPNAPFSGFHCSLLPDSLVHIAETLRESSVNVHWRVLQIRGIFSGTSGIYDEASWLHIAYLLSDRWQCRLENVCFYELARCVSGSADVEVSSGEVFSILRSIEDADLVCANINALEDCTCAAHVLVSWQCCTETLDVLGVTTNLTMALKEQREVASAEHQAQRIIPQAPAPLVFDSEMCGQQGISINQHDLEMPPTVSAKEKTGKPPAPSSCKNEAAVELPKEDGLLAFMNEVEHLGRERERSRQKQTDPEFLRALLRHAQILTSKSLHRVKDFHGQWNLNSPRQWKLALGYAFEISTDIRIEIARGLVNGIESKSYLETAHRTASEYSRFLTSALPESASTTTDLEALSLVVTYCRHAVVSKALLGDTATHSAEDSSVVTLSYTTCVKVSDVLRQLLGRIQTTNSMAWLSASTNVHRLLRTALCMFDIAIVVFRCSVCKQCDLPPAYEHACCLFSGIQLFQLLTGMFPVEVYEYFLPIVATSLAALQEADCSAPEYRIISRREAIAFLACVFDQLRLYNVPSSPNNILQHMTVWHREATRMIGKSQSNFASIPAFHTVKELILKLEQFRSSCPQILSIIKPLAAQHAQHISE